MKEIIDLLLSMDGAATVTCYPRWFCHVARGKQGVSTGLKEKLMIVRLENLGKFWFMIDVFLL